MYTSDERKTLAAAALIKATKRTANKKARPRQVKPTAKNQRQVRERDNAYLAWVRRLPCIAGLIEGGCSGPMEAAHLRYSNASVGRINPGLQRKSHDRFAVGMCRGHHQHDQHLASERFFWERLGVDPDDLTAALYAAFHSNHPGEEIIRQFAQAARKA